MQKHLGSKIDEAGWKWLIQQFPRTMRKSAEIRARHFAECDGCDGCDTWRDDYARKVADTG